MIETNFKHTDIGVIPHDWEVKSLDSLFAFYAGGDIQKEYFSMTPQENKRYPIYSNSLEHKGLYGYTSNPRYEANSITITGRGSLGHAEFRNHKFDAIVRLLVLQPKELVSGEFITNTINFYMPFVFESTGVPQLTVPQTAKALIPLPPTLAEQEKIANALSKIDQLINDLGALIEKKKAIKQGTMQDLLTAKRRLKGFTGEWKEKQLKEICERYDNLRIPISAKLRKKGNTPYYGANGIQDYVEGYTHDGEFILVAEDGANSLSNYPIKYVIGKIWVNNHAHVITAKDEKTNNVYLSYALKCVDFESNIVGSGRAKLNADTLMQLSVVIPPTLAEQNAIANILSSMDTEIINLEQKRDKYIAIKQGMMQNLLTGKIRLI